nr:hypothetical protein [Tanacetum cinerariifolium]
SATSSQEASKSPVKFNMKKSLKIRPKRSNKKEKNGKNKRLSFKSVAEASSSDVMME